MEQDGRPPEVRATHLARLAVIYLRQSSPRQVEENTGSTAAQRAQAQHAKRCGWSERDIVVIEDDLGVTGTSTLNRKGYRWLVDQIDANLVGNIYVTDIKRAGRDAPELVNLLARCRRHDTLLTVNGTVHDLRDSGQLFSQQILSLVADYENVRRSENMQSCKVAKAKLGLAVSRPPAGYVSGSAKGTWEMDPDPVAQRSIRAVFEVFLEQRSLRRTVAALNERGIRLPVRGRHQRLRWRQPTVAVIWHMITNRAYLGDYEFRRQRVNQTGDRLPSGNWPLRRATPGETIRTPGHHAPYVSPQEWAEIEQVRKNYAPSREWRNLGPGSALLQGRLRCAKHTTRVMSPQYGQSRQDPAVPHVYHCVGDFEIGEKRCLVVPGNRLDCEVWQILLTRLQAPSLEVVRDAWRRALETEHDEVALRRAELQRARQAAQDAERRYNSVIDANNQVKLECERRWNEALENLKQVEARHRSSTPSAPTMTEDAWGELMTLCQDVTAILDAPTTEPRDKKELLRTFVDSVFVEARTREFIRARIAWADGTPDTPIEVKLPGHTYILITAWAAEGLSPSAIARKLNAQGLVNKLGRRWSCRAVAKFLRSRERPA